MTNGAGQILLEELSLQKPDSVMFDVPIYSDVVLSDENAKLVFVFKCSGDIDGFELKGLSFWDPCCNLFIY